MAQVVVKHVIPQRYLLYSQQASMTAKSLLNSSLIWLASVKVTEAWCQANHMSVNISLLKTNIKLKKIR
jgi:hypothetical protein